MKKGQTLTSQVSAARGPGLGAGLSGWGKGRTSSLYSWVGLGSPHLISLFRAEDARVFQAEKRGE